MFTDFLKLLFLLNCIFISYLLMNCFFFFSTFSAPPSSLLTPMECCCICFILGILSAVHISGTAYVENTEVIEITCNATSGGRPPRDITWFKDGEIITPDPNNDRIQIHTHIHMVARSLISKLVIERSHLEDAGIYVCRTSDLKATEFKVHVLNTYGE